MKVTQHIEGAKEKHSSFEKERHLRDHNDNIDPLMDFKTI
jgi:hypothetical protein